MSYFSEIAWGTLTKNVIPYYSVGVFQLNTYTIDVDPIDVNEPGASTLDCNIDDYFLDYLGYPWKILAKTSISSGLRIRVYDINERSISEYINYGPYPNKIGYVYRPTKNGIILSQSQLLKLDSQARDRINNFEKGVLWESRGFSIYDNSSTHNQVTKIQLGNNLAINSSSEDPWYGGFAKIIGIDLTGTDNGFLLKGSSGEIVNSEYLFSTDSTLSSASDTQISSTLAIKTYVDNVSSGGNFLDSVIRMVINNTFDPGASPTAGDRYILETLTIHANFGTISGVGLHDIVEYSGSAFVVVFDASGASTPATVTVGTDKNGSTNHQWTYNTTDDEWVDRGAIGNHNDLSGLNVGDYVHLTASNHTDLTDLGDCTIHYHSSDRDRSNHTGTQLSSTISDLTETIQDTVSLQIQNDPNSYLTWVYNDTSGLLTPSVNRSSINYWTDDGSQLVSSRSYAIASNGFRITAFASTAFAKSFALRDSTNTTGLAAFGFYGNSDVLTYLYFGDAYNSSLNTRWYPTGNLGIQGKLAVNKLSASYTLDVAGTGYFTGSVIGITESTSDSSTKFATTAFVKNQNYITLTGLNSIATGLTYTNTTGVFSLTSGYSIPTTTKQSEWDTAYLWGNHASAGYMVSSSYPDLNAIEVLSGTSGFLKKTAVNTWSLDTNTYLTGNQSISITGAATGSGTTAISLSLATPSSITGTSTNTGGTGAHTHAVSGLTNSNLSGSAGITNANLANSSITVQGTSVSLGSSVNIINGTGFVKSSGTTISYDTNTYLTSNQTITLSGDVSGSGTTSISVTVADNSHNHLWSNITSTPTTASGYGITDVYTKTESNANYTGKASYGSNNFYGDYLIFRYDLLNNDYISFNKTNNKYYLNSGEASMQNTSANAGIVASAFYVQGGTSSGFLKANGSVDTNTYATQSWVTSQGYLTSAVTSLSAASPIVTSGSTGSITLTHATSGVSASTYGSATQTPVFAVNTYGHVTSVTNTTITPAQISIVPDSFTTLTYSSNITWNLATDENVYLELTGTPSELSLSNLSSGQTGVAILLASGGDRVVTLSTGLTEYIDSAAPTTGTAGQIKLTSGEYYVLTFTCNSSMIFFNIANYVAL